MYYFLGLIFSNKMLILRTLKKVLVLVPMIFWSVKAKTYKKEHQKYSETLVIIWLECT